jgi:type IV pilus assembly protein PilP
MSEHRMKLNFALSLLLVVAALATVAQTTPPATTTGSTSSTSTTGSDVQKSLEEILEEPTTTDTYRYDPQGRRDPFRSLIGPTPKTDLAQRPAGVPGFLIDEIKLQGVVKTPHGLAAMVSGPDNNGYLVRVGQKTFDGEVIRITQGSVVFRQEVNDPTRIERYREVVKELNPGAKR